MSTQSTIFNTCVREILFDPSIVSSDNTFIVADIYNIVLPRIDDSIKNTVKDQRKSIRSVLHDINESGHVIDPITNCKRDVDVVSLSKRRKLYTFR